MATFESKVVKGYNQTDQPTTLEGNHYCFPCDKVVIDNVEYCPEPVTGRLVSPYTIQAPKGYGCESLNNKLIQLSSDNTRTAYLDKYGYKERFQMDASSFPNNSSSNQLKESQIMQTKFVSTIYP